MEKKIRCYIWRRMIGETSPSFFTGYMTAEKPYHEWGMRKDAHLFTLNQAMRIVRSFRSNKSTIEFWGYERVYGQQ